ncbi:MAG TPA: murein biosynthesis integral membrane protein MurJ [Polyangiaceae bacterium]|nr:murein biosynthesis integral membrane protein MurJ [Polyangiaceae bacterium]
MTAEADASGERAAERRALTSRAGVVAAGTLVSRVLGLGREVVLAGMFSRAATDAFTVAFTIPNTFRQLLAEGAVNTAVLPVLAQTRETEGEAAAKRFFAAARGLSLVVLGAVSVLGVVFAPELVELFAAGADAVPGQHERTTLLTRWVFPYIFFMGTAALGTAALNSAKRFAVTAFAPALLNVSCIAFALALPAFFAARGDEPVLAMAIGALVGGALQVVAQWPSLIQIGYFTRPRLDLSHPGVREALRRMGPTLVGLGVYFIDVLLARRFLSELGVGPQTYFAFALRLCDFPQGIFVMAIQTAALPSMALLAAKNDKRGLEDTYAFGVRLTLFVAIGATVLFVALSGPIVALVFQRGHFDAHASQETASALVAQGLGIWMVAVVRQLVAVYFACGDTRTPVVVSFIDFCAFVALALALRGPLGHVGIGLAVTGSSAVQMLLLWWRLRAHVGSRRLGEIARSAATTLASAVAAGLVAVPVARLLGAPRAHGITLAGAAPTAADRLLAGAGSAAAFIVVFFAVAHALKSEELATVLAAARRRRR